MTNISIIGAGRLGTSLGYALSKKGYRIKAKGALTASLHPIQSFSQKKTEPTHFENIYFGLEGYIEALALSQKIVKQLGGHPLILQAKDKALYHAACSTASNFFVVLLDMAVFLLQQIGLQEEKALEMAKREKELSPQKIKALENLLEGK